MAIRGGVVKVCQCFGMGNCVRCLNIRYNGGRVDCTLGGGVWGLPYIYRVSDQPTSTTTPKSTHQHA